MKYVFLINSFSNKNEAVGLSRKISTICENLGMDYKIEVNSEKRSTEDILAGYKDRHDIIFAIGGDGTINRVLNSIAETDNVLGIIPNGTGNDLYRSISSEFKEVINDADLIKINDRYFVNVACFGIDADIANNNDIVHSKIIPKSQRYNISLLYNFLKYKNREMTVYINDQVIRGEFGTIAVCNGEYYGGGYHIGYTSKLNDGLLDVYLAENLNKVNMAKLILSMKTGAHESSKSIQKLQTDHLVIESPVPIKSNIDGEELESDKFDIQVAKKKLVIYHDDYLVKRILN